jgi:hypothetical protein
MPHVITDIEIIGSTWLVVCHTLESGKTRHFWHKDRDDFLKLYKNPRVTFVGFNSHTFDAPLIQAWVEGQEPHILKRMANAIIEENLQPWQSLDRFGIGKVSADWIDIMPAAPGVKVSLKTYEGRMHFPTMVDLVIDHDEDPDDLEELLEYCVNDVMATTELFRTIQHEITLREQMSEQYGLDLRSKSGPQIAEAVIIKRCGIERTKRTIPGGVRYKRPDFIQTDNPLILDLIKKIEAHKFAINQNNGSPEFPSFLKEPIKLNDGIYQFGIGGLHSQHDTKVHYENVSDFDIASMYPSLILRAGFAPDIPNFIKTYRKMFDERIAAKRAGDTATANSLKLSLNGLFGKLGSMYSSVYSPDLMLAVTISGQLLLLTVIDRLEQIEGVRVLSANTDGLVVSHPTPIMHILEETGFDWEETQYREIAFRDVNSYIAVTTDGKVKRKGAFALSGVLQGTNPSFDICADAAAQWLADRTPIRTTIEGCRDIRKFVAVRNVTGGGTQHISQRTVDDWQLVEDNGNATNKWHSAVLDKSVERKSRPHPVTIDTGGMPFGRVARWYRSTRPYKPLSYIKSGNKVPDTDNARLCLTLPTTFPDDIDYDWYVRRAEEMLIGAGIDETRTSPEYA